MSRDDLKLRLDGDSISPRTLASAISRYVKALDALTDDVGSDADVKWVLTGLSMSRPTISVSPKSPQVEMIETLQTSYVEMWSSIQLGTPFPFSTAVRSCADAMTDLLNGEIKALSFEGDGQTIEITSPSKIVPASEMRITTFGRLEGRARRLDGQQGAKLRFDLDHTGYSRNVRCHVTEDEADQLREIWLKRVAVEGDIEWDITRERPVSMRNIRSIAELDPPQRLATGSLRGVPVPEGAEEAGSILRRLRDEW